MPAAEEYAGFWTLDSDRSDNYSDVLAAQQVSWIVRTVIGKMTLTYDVAATSTDGVPTLTSVNAKGAKQTFVIDGKPHADEDAVFGPVVHTATFDESGNFKLVTVCEKNKWTNTGVWTLSENNTVHVRTMHFESPKLTKDFVMTFTKKQ
ncbi:hypothetical protein DFS34DRAFT_419505 [Phlyctochytrium arcticum]|nr:hypothetical protein DFS34DRAFT_419505 [Phlyctochytrium arcticum]